MYRSICNSISLSVQGRASQVSFSVFENAIGYIADNYSQKLTLDEVARQAFMSPSYFSNCFHQRMGVTFSEYVSLIRMEKAKELLREPGMKIYEVAEKSGYEDFRHFGKMFKKYVDVSPAQYQANLKFLRSRELLDTTDLSITCYNKTGNVRIT